MNKLILIFAVSLPLFFGVSTKPYSTTSVVTIVGAKIIAQNANVAKKHKREDCPVCKGKGWYMSGDGIAKIQCQYCEP